jgi:hypothetical protein
VLTLANAVGATTATKAGAGQNVASRGAVEDLLRECAAGSDKEFARCCLRTLELLRDYDICAGG